MISDVLQKLQLFPQRKLLVIGDFMLDTYIRGNVERISPEAPVPVVAVIDEENMPGGAGNVAHNLVSLGSQAVIAGVCGKDANGNKLRQMLEELTINTDGLVHEARRPTTCKTRITGGNQQMLRIDRELLTPLKAETNAMLLNKIAKLLPDCDGVIISDYAKAVVSKDLMLPVTQQAKALGKFVLVDPKTSDFTQYPGATMIKPNQKEAQEASGIKITDEASLFQAGRILLDKADSKYIVITCGSEGMALFQRHQKPRRFPVLHKRRVYDVSGAGDTVLSMIALSMSVDLDDVAHALELANIAGSIVVGKPGTAQVSLDEVINELNNETC